MLNFFKNFKVVLIILMLFPMLASFSYQAAAETPIIRVQLDYDYPPFSYEYGDNILGFDKDLMTMIFHPQDYKVLYSADYWHRVLQNIREGKVQVTSFVVRTPEREEFMLFTNPIMKSYLAFYAVDEMSHFSLNNLNEFSIGVVGAYYEESILRNDLEIANYHSFDNNDQLIAALLNREVDLIFANQEVLNYFIIQRNLKGVVKPVMVNLFPLEFSYGVAKDRPELVEYINKRIAELKAAGIYEELHLRYFFRHSEHYLQQQQKGYYKASTFLLVTLIITFFTLRYYIRYLRDKIKKEQSFSQDIIQNSNTMIASWSPEGIIRSINNHGQLLIGYSQSELIGKHWTEYIDFSNCKINGQELTKRILSEGTIDQIILRVKCKDGQVKDVSWNMALIEGPNGVEIYGIGIDITQRLKMEKEQEAQKKALQQSEERYRLAIEGSKDGIYDWDIANNSFYFPKQTREILGLSEQVEINTLEDLLTYFHPDDVDPTISNLSEHIAGKTNYFQAEFRMRTKDGDYRWIQGRGKVIFDDEGNPVRIAGSNTDITEVRNAQEEIRRLAFFDTLTGLPNKVQLENMLKWDMTSAVKNKKKLAVLFLDLDNFKSVNDTFGHVVGDELLKEFANRLTSLWDGKVTLARMGGDEFILIVKDTSCHDKIVQVCKRIFSSLNMPFRLRNQDLFMTASIGISIFPQDGKTIEDLFRNADAAMYEAKREGKNMYRFFTRLMHEKAVENLEFTQFLRHAIEHQELELYYQPQVDIISAKIIGVEALVRWNHPSKGIISPGRFIPLAEETGFIIPLGEWVLKTACAQLVEWQAKGILAKDFIMSVNLSPYQIQQVDLEGVILDILEQTDCPPHCLQLEITESMAMLDIEKTVSFLKTMESKGVGIALDDFGIGYSSISYLNMLPIHTVKIDKSFIRNIKDDPNRLTVVKAIIELVNQMNMQVVAEGVEEEVQVQLLRENNCNVAQGYYFSRPLPAHMIIDTISIA